MNIQLNEKEVQILTLLSEGLDQEAISKKVFLSKTYVKYHISMMCDKLGISSKKSIELVAYAALNGLLNKNGQKDTDTAASAE